MSAHANTHSQSNSQVAVLTGATGGIGRAIATTLSAAGWQLVLHGRSQEKLRALAAQCPSAVTMAADIADPAVPAQLLSTALQHFGRCDLCINNAGILETGPIPTIDIDRVCHMVRINVEAAFRVAYTFVRHFTEQDSGHLVNISSVLGTKVRPTAGAYAGTKHAIEALSEALRMELARTNVRVSCIEPGLVRTGLHDRWPVHPSQSMGIPTPLTPQDVARALLFLLDQPAHVRIPKLMILPRDHEI